MSDMRLRGPCESEHAQAPLISALVIAYNNSDFIFDTLQSVLTQDYPNIELIVSDDHSTKGFPVDEIIDYINKHRGENIQRVLINENEENMGTVRHVEKLRGMSRGEYELLIAADDVWKDSRVFSDFMDFVSAHEDEHVEWVVSQLEMCDERMHFDRLFVNENTIDLLKRGDMEGLREHIASVAILPSVGCMYKKSFFDKIGSLNAYSLIEDYSAHVRALRMNVRPFYLDRVTAKHRGAAFRMAIGVLEAKKARFITSIEEILCGFLKMRLSLIVRFFLKKLITGRGIYIITTKISVITFCRCIKYRKTNAIYPKERLGAY